MKILVTGAKGMLGKDLCSILFNNGFEVFETDIDNMDITNYSLVKKNLIKEKPNVIIHCAAYTDVEKAQNELDLARNINAKATKNLAKIIAKINSTVVYLSTDYVFDGLKKGKYTPCDIPNPINNYGLTKLEGEKGILKYCKKHYIVRTSWLYGHHGKNFVETIISKANDPLVKVIKNQIGCPTWTKDLSYAIVTLLNKKYPYGIYHLCGGGETSRYDFAKEIFNLMNLDVNLVPCLDSDYQSVAPRPKNSAMDNNRLCRSWKKALIEYLKLRVN